LSRPAYQNLSSYRLHICIVNKELEVSGQIGVEEGALDISV
jgi:hypothetical protein